MSFFLYLKECIIGYYRRGKHLCDKCPGNTTTSSTGKQSRRDCSKHNKVYFVATFLEDFVDSIRR